MADGGGRVPAITGYDRDILAALRAAAEAGAPAPSNLTLMKHGAPAPYSVTGAIRRLVKANAIAVHKPRGNQRVFEIVGTGQKTAPTRMPGRPAEQAGWKIRRCLGCGEDFRSEWAGNRQCDRCKSLKSYRSTNSSFEGP